MLVAVWIRGAEGSLEVASLASYGTLLGRKALEGIDRLGKGTYNSCRQIMGVKESLFLGHAFDIQKISSIYQ